MVALVPPTAYPVDQRYGLIAGDYTGDGKLDLGTGAATVVPGVGDGTCGATIGVPATVGVRGHVEAGDLNGDGKLDLVSFGSTIRTFLGDGAGRLALVDQKPLSAQVQGVALRDVNRDGKLDVIVSDARASGGVLFFAGKGDGHLSDPVASPGGVGYVSGLGIGDFDSDGNLDAVVVNQGGGPPEPCGISLLRGRGDGTFKTPELTRGNFCGQAVTTADLNRDGNVDLVVGNQLLVGTGTGTFAPPQPVPGGEPVDMDGDGNPDLISGAGTTVYVAHGNGDGSFSDPIPFRAQYIGGEGAGIAQVTTGDFNGDGLTDVATADGGGPDMLVLIAHRLQPGRCANRRLSLGYRQPTFGTDFGDYMYGVGTARDILHGGAGDDCLYGGPRTVTVGSGRFTRVVSDGADDLYGDAGNDVVIGRKGRDRLWGGTGNDRIVANDGSPDRIDCGPGRDAAIVDRHDSVRGCERVTVRR
jgi:Ca2+-binding RTX toxin-like protein